MLPSLPSKIMESFILMQNTKWKGIEYVVVKLYGVLFSKESTLFSKNVLFFDNIECRPKFLD